MAASEVQICNNALIKLGGNTIISLSDDTKVGRLCNKMYTIVRDDLLRAHIWNFALVRVTLARLATTPAFDYDFEYQLPSDCLRVIRIDDSRGEYRIEGRKLLTDENTIKLLYIKRVTDTSQFDSSFDNVLALKLASELAYSITNSVSLTKAIKEEFDREFRRAKMTDAQEDSLYVLQTTEFLDAHLFGVASSGIVFESSTN